MLGWHDYRRDAMVGALIVASLSTGLQMMNVAPAWQYVLKAIVLTLLADVYFKKNCSAEDVY